MREIRHQKKSASPVDVMDARGALSHVRAAAPSVTLNGC